MEVTRTTFIRCGLLLLTTLGVHPAFALDPGRRISQYGHTAWRLSDDALGGPPTAIAQSVDGYLWIGTHNGLLRFDGVRFVNTKELTASRALSTSIVSLFGDRNGDLWIGTSNELHRWRAGSLHTEMSGFRAPAITQDAAGAIWFTRTRIQQGTGSLCAIVSGTGRCYGPRDGVPLTFADPILLDARSNVWAGGAIGVVRWDGKAFSAALPTALRDEDERLQGTTALASLADGTVLVGIERGGPGLGVQQLKDGVWSDFKNASFDASRLDVTALLVDRDGAVWIGTANDGIYHMHGDRSDHYDSGDGLSGNAIGKFFEDREGNVWATTPQGLDRFRDLEVSTYSAREGLATDWFSSVVAAKDGGVWLATWGGLYRIRNGDISVIDQKSGLPGKLVTALLEDAQGTLWLGVDSDLYRYDAGRFRVVKKADGGSLGPVVALVQDAPDSILVQPTRSGVLTRLQNGRVRDSIAPPEGTRYDDVAQLDSSELLLLLSDGRLVAVRNGKFEPLLTGVRDIGNGFKDAADSFWLAHRDGLLRWEKGRHRTLDARSGLPCDRLYSATSDRSGNVWLYSECGLVRIATSELQRWWNDAAYRPAFLLLDSTRGAFPAGSSFNPTATVDDKGTIWFVTEMLAQSVDPRLGRTNPLPPPVHIENVLADGKRVAADALTALPALTREVQIDFTALSFSNPSQMRFKYRLEGVESAWREVGTRRQAIFSNLAPGDYRFQVVASNNDGVWNMEGASVSFAIAPTYYQTGWFRALCVLLLALSIWALVTIRIRTVVRQVRGRLAERLAERERIARDLHDTLLQGFHGLMLRFQVAVKQIPPQDRARLALEETLDRADSLLAESRERIRDLRSENNSVPQLPEALASVAEDLQREMPIQYHVTVEGTARDIEPLIRDEMYLLGREALTNAFRHSQGTMIEVEVHFDTANVRLRVRDNGKGIADETLRNGGLAGHWGLSGMQERALRIGGELKIWNRAGAGAEVELEVPAKIAYAIRAKRRFWRFGASKREG
jgi:signal transduction histidine kinase/ligand-binding sensor domain-containing protein